MIQILRGKVIGFIEGNDYKIISNIGVDKDVKVGMPFIIYYEGDKVIDPDTKEDLGKLEYIKAKVRVSQVSEKYCILESDEFTFKKTSLFETLMEDRAINSSRPRIRSPLKLARGKDKVSLKNKEEIAIGDLVRSDPSRN